jgi:hypothetical protein
MTTPVNLLRSLAQHMHASSDPDDRAVLPAPREIQRRLVPFNIPGDSSESGYLAVCFRDELRDLEARGFDSRRDATLCALGRVALQRVTDWGSYGFSLQLDAVLYDADAADLYGGLLIDTLPARLHPAVESLQPYDETLDVRKRQLPTADVVLYQVEVSRKLDKTLEAATLLTLLSGNDDLKDELFHLFQHPDVVRLGRSTVQNRHRRTSELFAVRARDSHLFRERMRRELAELHLGRYRFLEPYWDLEVRSVVRPNVEDANDGVGDTVDSLSGSARLTFTILPEESGVSGFVTEREQFHALRLSGTRFEVDRRRTDVLLRLEEWAGPNRCTLYRGNRTTDSRLFDGENITEDYLVLAIDRDSGGQDAVAISPLRGRNATFIVRHDVSELPWHEVFALSKRSATGLGAKRMQFQARWSTDEYEAMFEKVTTALDCPPERFGEKFRYSIDRNAYIL